MKKLVFFIPLLFTPSYAYAFGLDCEGICVPILFLVFIPLPIALLILGGGVLLGLIGIKKFDDNRKKSKKLFIISLLGIVVSVPSINARLGIIELEYLYYTIVPSIFLIGIGYIFLKKSKKENGRLLMALGIYPMIIYAMARILLFLALI